MHTYKHTDTCEGAKEVVGSHDEEPCQVKSCPVRVHLQAIIKAYVSTAPSQQGLCEHSALSTRPM